MRLKEFAPSPERDDHGPDEEEILRQYAARWYNGDEDPRVEKLLATMGWEIGQNEDEAGGAFMVRHGDINGNSFISWSDAELSALNEISDELRQNYLQRAGRHVDRRMDHMARVRDRLNKGYEIYHADRPTAIVDRFEADTPALARQYYEKFVHKYESDVDFDLRLRRSTGIIEEARIPRAIEGFLDSLNPDDVGVEEFGAYRVHFEGFTDDCKSSRDYRRNPDAVYDQVFADFIAREGGAHPVDSGMVGDERYPILYSIFKIPRQVKEIARIPQGDFGDADTLTAPKYAIEKKPLPGGAGFTYAVGKPDAEDLEIMIFDGDTLAAELDLFYTRDATKAWRVSTVAVDPKYRSRGLGKALYGIALSILRLTVEAGDTQTKYGQRMWLMLNSIPGVEVRGYNMERTPDYKPGPNDKIISQDKNWTKYTFPVRPGVNSMRSARRGTGMYTSQASMIAKWTGQ